MNKIYLYVILYSFNFASNFIPDDNVILNYTQIFFKWPQIPFSENYILTVIDQDSDDSIELNTNHNSLLLDSFIDWDSNYLWYVCGYDNQEIVECSNDNFFSINSLPDFYPINTNVLSSDSLQYNNGITLLDFESLNFSASIDMTGEPVWFADKFNFPYSRVISTDFLENGNILGFCSGVGAEFDLNSNIIFQTNIDSFQVHHEIHKTSNESYFLIDAISQINPCIDCELDFPDLVSWRGDRFIEVNSNGDVIWEWNTFDYLSLLEYNPLWMNSIINNNFDWTHSNSVEFIEDDQSLLVSIRNLSRIIKIDYLTKEIIWSYGDPDFMLDNSFNDFFNFSHQHSAQNYNGNVLFFDNGRNNNPEVSRCLEVSLDYENSNSDLVWEYVLPDSMVTLSRGECDRLDNGNTLITAGRTGNILEVNSSGEIVWHFNADANSGPIPGFYNDLSMYRSHRIPNLYPVAFSFQLENLSGDYSQQNFEIVSNNILSGEIYNKGWKPNEFLYCLFDINDDEIFCDSIYIESNESCNFSINLNDFDLNDNQEFKIQIYPQINSTLSQYLTFNFLASLFGDVNSDSQIDILDIVDLVYYAINSDYIYNADFNSDQLINILDIIFLVNIILDYE